MKKNISVILTVVLFVCTMVTSAAFAGTSVGGSQTNYQGSSDLADRLRQVSDFKFYHHENGIGYGVCPVYSAPSESAFRLADGKACVATDYDMYEAGYDVTGWLLVRYETNNGGVNVGYIPPKYVQQFKSPMETREFEYIPVTAEKTIYVTNNPLLNGSYFAILDPGETFHILAKYTYHGDWWYVECTVDGQMARGFVSRESSSFYLDNSSSYDYSEEKRSWPVGAVCNIVNSSYLNARSGPGTDYGVVSHVSQGNSFTILDCKLGNTGKDWYQINVNGIICWISSGYTEVEDIVGGTINGARANNGSTVNNSSRTTANRSTSSSTTAQANSKATTLDPTLPTKVCATCGNVVSISEITLYFPMNEYEHVYEVTDNNDCPICHGSIDYNWGPGDGSALEPHDYNGGVCTKCGYRANSGTLCSNCDSIMLLLENTVYYEAPDPNLDVDYHFVENYQWYYCNNCGYSTGNTIVSQYYEPHQFDNNNRCICGRGRTGW